MNIAGAVRIYVVFVVAAAGVLPALDAAGVGEGVGAGVLPEPEPAFVVFSVEVELSFDEAAFL
jgi:hypothetical protein